MSPGIVIVGAGETGARAAMALREIGYAGPVTLIGDEAHPPYERPPLSKAVLQSDDELPVPRIGDTVRFDELGIAHLTGSVAVAIDRARHEVRLSSGRKVPYDRLLLATGAVPRRLTVRGAARFATSAAMATRWRSARASGPASGLRSSVAASSGSRLRRAPSPAAPA